MINSIVQIMDEIIHINRQLIEIADRKKTMIIERNMDDLNKLIPEEEELVKKIGHYENELLKLSENPFPVTFSELIEQIPEESTRKKLQEKQASMLNYMVELQEKNQMNESLLKDSLQFVRHMMEQITKSKQQQSFNYQSPLQKQNTSINSRGFFDTKA